MTISVVLADDDPMVRIGLRAVISHEADMRVVGEAADGDEVIDVVERVDPDVVLMDVRMPNRDGLSATRVLTSRHPSRPRIVILTTFELDEYVYDALQAGAAGFLLKRVAPKELLEAIRVVGSGESLIFPALTRRLVERSTVPTEAADRRLRSLTNREREVLREMARGLSNQEIAECLFIGTETVKSHVANILAKLGARDRIHAVIYAYETGVAPGSSPEADSS